MSDAKVVKFPTVRVESEDDRTVNQVLDFLDANTGLDTLSIEVIETITAMVGLGLIDTDNLD